MRESSERSAMVNCDLAPGWWIVPNDFSHTGSGIESLVMRLGF